MPKSMKRRNSKGGTLLDSINDGWNTVSQSVSNGVNTIRNDISEFWNKTKNQNSYSGSDNYSYTNQNPSYSSSYNNYTRGGRKRRRGTRRRSLRGGYSRQVYPNLASQAAPYHGEHTARVKWIGGGKRRKISRKNKH